MKYLLTLLIYACSNLFAAELDLGFTHSNNLILRGDDCPKLYQQRKAICDWKSSLDPQFEEPPSVPKCVSEGKNGKRLVISECLPEFSKKFMKKPLYRSGANCWGTALSFLGLSKRPRFVWAQEMLYWQNSPLCQKVGPNEKLLPGDIISVFGPEYIFEGSSHSKGDDFWRALYPDRLTKPPVEKGYSGYHHFLHSEIYISDQLTFGKVSPYYGDRFEFHRLNEVYGRPRDMQCQENQNLDPWLREYQRAPKNIRHSKCSYFSIAYRCRSFQDYFSPQWLNETEKSILADIRSLDRIQSQLFSYLVENKFSLDVKTIKQAIELADRESDHVLKLLRTMVQSKNIEMLLVWKYMTAEGIRKSLELADVIEPSESL